jgi:hypothetical protein
MLIILNLTTITLYNSLRFQIFTKLKSSLSKFRDKFRDTKLEFPELQEPDWIELIGKGLETWDSIKQIEFDITANAYTISLPEDHYEDIKKLRKKTKVIRLMSIFDGKRTNITYIPQVTPLFRVHQFSRKVLKKFPDSALLGMLTLSSLELIKRQLNSDTFGLSLPPLLKEAVNITNENLNAKLEMLSSLSWDVELFSKTELEFLQTQPLEVIEKYIIKELLPKIDKDLSPVLVKLIANPQKITVITRMINQFIHETAMEFNKSYVGKNYYMVETLPIHETAMKIVENVDKVGLSFEEGEL